MFLRVDLDLFVNINNIFSFKLFDEGDVFKLFINGCDGKIVTTVYYLKSNSEQMNILREVVDNLREITVNPERLPLVEPQVSDEESKDMGEPVRHILEKLENPEEEQLSLDLD